MNIYEVQAYIYDKKIGTIILKDGITYFQYDEEFRNSNYEISPLKLPLSLNSIYTNNDDKYFQGLAGVFHDSLPDKFGTKVIQRYFESKNISSYELNIIQKLMFLGDKSIGAISYRPNIYKIDDEKKYELIQLNQFYENAKKIVQGDEIEVVDEMLHFMDSAASAGGARAKAIIGYDKISKKIISGISNNLPKNYEHYLIKFDLQKDDGSSSDYTKLEYLYMSLASEVGIDIPDISLITQGNLSHYLIKRFDRINGQKLHLHSVCGLTHSNFNIPMHYSYDDLLRLTRYLTLSQDAVNQQYKRMIFNIIGRNQDDHAKNFSFIMNKEAKWSISPAYDITYSNGNGYTKNHQLSLRGKTDDFSIQDLLYLAKLHSIKEKTAIQIIEQIKEQFSTFSKKAKTLDINSKTIKKIDENLYYDSFK